MRVGVLGTGAVGTRAARQLALTADMEVFVSDEDPVAARRVADALGQNVMAVTTVVGLDDLDAVVIATPTPQAEFAERFVRAGVPVVSTTDDPGDAGDLYALDDLAAERGVLVVVGAGFAPGLSCLLARHGSHELDRVDEIHVARHGTGGPACARQHHHSLGGTARWWRDGDWIEQPAGSGRELCWFPDPIGAYDCYRAEMADPLLLRRAFPSASRISARTSGTRRDRLTARLPMLRPPHPEGAIGAIRVELRGTRAGMRETVVFGAIDRAAVAAGAVAAVAALLVAPAAPSPGLARHAGEPALAPPSGDGPSGRLVGAHSLAAKGIDVAAVLAELASRGVKAARFTGGHGPGW